jgi:hypothetical protein
MMPKFIVQYTIPLEVLVDTDTRSVDAVVVDVAGEMEGPRAAWEYETLLLVEDFLNDKDSAPAVTLAQNYELWPHKWQMGW